MKQVFGGINAIEAHVVSHLLEQHGIATNLSGDYLSGASGELPAGNLTSVWVMDDKDFDRARELIKEWEEEQAPVPKHKNKTPYKKSSIIPGWFIGLLVGLSISYAYFQIPTISDEYDNNDDGIADTFYYYSTSNKLKRIEFDLNFNNKIDRKDYLNNRGMITETAIDTDSDGIFETKITYKDGNPFIENIDKNNDGIIERTFFYTPIGQPKTQKIRDENTGKVVKVTDYEMGIMTSARMDTDGDGKMDVSYTYDKYEEIRTKTPIKDASME